MEDRAFGLIQKLDVIGLGTAIIFILVMGFIIVTVYRWQQKMTKDHDDRVLKEYQHDQEYENMINKTNELQNKLEGICDEISNMVKVVENNNKKTMERIDELEGQLNDAKESLKKISDIVEILIGSDMEQNRHTIVAAYNEYVVPGKAIDIYTLQNVRDAYKWYSAEHGNSHISDLMLDFERLKRNDLNATYIDYAAGKIKVLHGYLEDKVVDIDENHLVQ